MEIIPNPLKYTGRKKFVMINVNAIKDNDHVIARLRLMGWRAFTPMILFGNN